MAGVDFGDGDSDSGRFALVLVMGLPGCGKTTVCRTLAEADSRCSHLEFDAAIPDTVVADSRKGVETAGWKQHRSCLLLELDRILFDRVRPGVREQKYFTEPPSDLPPELAAAMAERLGSALANQRPGRDGVLLLDDNFYYGSMRHSVYQLARFYECGYGCVHIRASIGQVKLVNSLRERPVPSEVIDRMAGRLEAPDAGRNSWEKYSLALTDADIGFLDAAGRCTADSSNCKLRRLLADCLANPFSPEDPDGEARRRTEEAREACSLSLLHQADLRLRALVADWLAARSDAERAELGQLAAGAKRALMADLRDARVKVPAQLNAYAPEKQEELDRFLLAAIRLPP